MNRTEQEPTRLERIAALTAYRDQLRQEVWTLSKRLRPPTITRPAADIAEDVEQLTEARDELIATETILAEMGVGRLRPEHVSDETHCLDHIVAWGRDAAWCPDCARVGHWTCHHPDHEDFCIGEGA